MTQYSNNKKVAIKIVFVSVLILFLLIKAPTTEAVTNKYSMSYLYFGNKNLYKEYVDRTNNSIDTVSPNYFDLNADGTLKITDNLDQKFINEMHKSGKKVVPFLSNHWNREIGRKALEKRDFLSDELIKSIVKYDLDGVNIDIENLTEEDRELYTDFVKTLSEKMPKDKEISVAVAANPNSRQRGWQGSYDYNKLASYSDHIVIMTYDESYRGGQAGPVASIGFVEQSIESALKEVPRDKIVLGIPFYGRYWNSKESIGGYGIDLKRVEELIEKYNGQVIYDNNTLSPKAVFKIKEGSEKEYIYGRELKPGDYTIWFENEDSIKQKLKLVQKYGLKGSGSWSLGQETQETWEYYKLWLNGKIFADVENHWAFDAILAVESNGWMKGTSTLNFSPDKALTRAQAAVTLVRALELDSKELIDNNFLDVKKHWAKKEIAIAQQYGIIKGINDNYFAPDKPITREQMAAMLGRIFKFDDSKINYNPFTDIDSSNWAYDYILRLSKENIYNGFSDRTFRPSNNITRSQMATLLYRISPKLKNTTLN